MHEICQQKEHLIEQFLQEKVILKKETIHLSTVLKEKEGIIAGLEA